MGEWTRRGRVDTRRNRKRGSLSNDYFGPGQQATLAAWKELPAGLTRQEAAARLGTTKHALNAVIRNAKRRGLLEPTLTPIEAFEEVRHLTEGGIPWEDAKRRVGIIPRTPLSGAVNDLRRTGGTSQEVPAA